LSAAPTGCDVQENNIALRRRVSSPDKTTSSRLSVLERLQVQARSFRRLGDGWHYQ
jgi:hypothetical protein